MTEAERIEMLEFEIAAAIQAKITAEAELTASLASLAVEMAALREERDAALAQIGVANTMFHTAKLDLQQQYNAVRAQRDKLAELVRDAQEFAGWIKTEGRYDMHLTSLEAQATDWLARAEEALKDGD